jgi:uncharacterized membrane protein
MHDMLYHFAFAELYSFILAGLCMLFTYLGRRKKTTTKKKNKVKKRKKKSRPRDKVKGSLS